MRRLSAAAALITALLLGSEEGKAQSVASDWSNPMILPANSRVILRLHENLYKKDARPGQSVEFEVAYDVVANGQTFIPSGTLVNGHSRGFDHTGKSPARVLFDLEPVRTVSGAVVRLTATEVRGTSGQPGFGVSDAISAGGETGALAPFVIPAFLIAVAFEKKVMFAQGAYGVARVTEDVAFDPAKLEPIQRPPSEVLGGGVIFLSLFVNAVREFPADRSGAAETLYRFGDLDGAIEECQKALALYPSSPEVHLQAAGLFREKGDATRAALESGAAGKLLLGRVQLNPLDERTRIDVINAFTDAGDLDAALAQAKEAMEALPDRPYFHYLLGRVLVKKNDPDAAIVELQQALEKYNQHLWPANCELGRAFELKGDSKAALRQYHTAVRAHGGDSECRAAYERLQLQRR